MAALVKDWLRIFLRCWWPGRFSLQRILVLLLLWPLLLLTQGINLVCLALDRVLFPGFRRVEVRAPLFVIGVPRSGTTFLHRLLALDAERFTTTTLWELLFAPSIIQRLFWSQLARLDRLCFGIFSRPFFFIERLALGWLDDVHATGLRAPEEDYLALIPVLGCFILVLPFPDMCLWQLNYFDRDVPAERRNTVLKYYRSLVQRHLYFHGADKTFLSKNPSFTPMVESLAGYFSDARFIACFRNPTAAVPSQVNSIIVGARLFDFRIDEQYWREGLMKMLAYYYSHLFEVLPTMPARRQTKMVMEKLASSPLDEVLRVYRQFGWQPGSDYLARLELEQARARRYRSKHVYSLQGLGISAAQLQYHYCFVYQRFGFPLPQETSAG